MCWLLLFEGGTFKNLMKGDSHMKKWHAPGFVTLHTQETQTTPTSNKIYVGVDGPKPGQTVNGTATDWGGGLLSL